MTNDASNDETMAIVEMSKRLEYMATIVFEESLEIPDGIRTLADFRRWTYCRRLSRNEAYRLYQRAD